LDDRISLDALITKAERLVTRYHRMDPDLRAVADVSIMSVSRIRQLEDEVSDIKKTMTKDMKSTAMSTQSRPSVSILPATGSTENLESGDSEDKEGEGPDKNLGPDLQVEKLEEEAEEDVEAEEDIAAEDVFVPFSQSKASKPIQASPLIVKSLDADESELISQIMLARPNSRFHNATSKTALITKEPLLSRLSVSKIERGGSWKSRRFLGTFHLGPKKEDLAEQMKPFVLSEKESNKCLRVYQLPTDFQVEHGLPPVFVVFSLKAGEKWRGINIQKKASEIICSNPHFPHDVASIWDDKLPARMQDDRPCCILFVKQSEELNAKAASHAESENRNYSYIEFHYAPKQGEGAGSLLAICFVVFLVCWFQAQALALQATPNAVAMWSKSGLIPTKAIKAIGAGESMCTPMIWAGFSCYTVLERVKTLQLRMFS